MSRFHWWNISKKDCRCSWDVDPLMKYISLLLFILLLCGCKQQELLNHLDQQQANDVLAVLQRHNINAEKKDQGKTGFSIFVEPTDFASAVDWLKIYNLPGKPDIQISQMFPADALVSSPRAEKQGYILLLSSG